MAGTTVVTSTKSGGIRRYSVAWTSDASGNVSGTSLSIGPGTIVGVGFTPGAGGSQPSDAYDVTVACADHGTDALAGEGANLSNAAGAHKLPMTGGTTLVRAWLHGGSYAFAVSNAGNAKSGVVDIYKIDGVA